MTPTNYDLMAKNKFGRTESKSRQENKDFVVTVTSQLWHKNGTFCPRGTIPIRRIQEMKQNFRNQSYGRKKPMHHFHVMQSNDTNDIYIANHSVCVRLRPYPILSVISA